MVLVLNGVPQTKCPQNIQNLYSMYPTYKESGANFLLTPTKVVGPMGLLYIQQRELAVTMPHDKNVNIIGSDSATTCIIVVVRHTGSGAAALAHYDGSGTNDICGMVQRVRELSFGYTEGRIELQLFGGYNDPKNYSAKLFVNLMKSFHAYPVEVHLTLACIGQLNTTVQNGIPWPIIYGIALNVKTGEMFPATFPDIGPEAALRSARNLTGVPKVMDVYDGNLGLLKIGPFNYKPLRDIDLWLEQNDDFILHHMSTSPDVEPPHFVSQIRATLKYIQDNPFPAVTVFRDNRPLYFKRDETTELWTPVAYEPA